MREISIPVTPLRLLQQKLNQVLQAVFSPRSAVHGFTLRRNILTNAAPHVGQRFVLNVDLEAFFPSINFGRVRGMFIGKPFNLPPSVATVLAQVCIIENRLPQGAPTSPIVANLVCRPLDTALQRLARKHRCVYTRYADDLTFSTSLPKFPSQLASTTDSGVVTIEPELRTTIEKAGFFLNPAKVRLAQRRSRQEVTGLIVNRRVNVSRVYVRQIRAMFHAWEKYGLLSAQAVFTAKYARRRNPKRPPPDFRRVLRGKIDFLRQIRGQSDPLYRKLLLLYARLDQDARLIAELTAIHPLEVALKGKVWVVESETDLPNDEVEFRQGTAFCLEGSALVTCAHVLGQRNEVFTPGDPTRRISVLVIARDDTRDVALLAAPGVPLCGTGLSAVKDSKVSLLDDVIVAGFPNYRLNDTVWLAEGKVSAFRITPPERRLLVSADIVRGMSGGPVLRPSGEVVGIAVTGADSAEAAGQTENRGVIPIAVVSLLGAD